MHSAVGERCRHAREVPAVDEQRALPEIVLERRHGLAVDDPEVLEHPRDGAIAKSRPTFRPVDGFVDGKGVPDERRHRLLDSPPLAVGGIACDKAGRRDCTGIDHGIERRTSLGIQADGIEGVPAWLHSHLARDDLRSPIRERRREDERLGDRLHREQRRRVPHRIGDAIHSDEAYPERLWIGLREFGYVRRERAVVRRREAAVELGEVVVDGGVHAGARSRGAAHHASGVPVVPSALRHPGVRVRPSAWRPTRPVAPRERHTPRA